MREWLELKGMQDWTNQANADGVKIDYRSSVRGFNTLRASAVLPFNIMDIFVTLMDAKSRPLYDVNIDESSHMISRIAANTNAIYQKSKKIFVVSSRDFVLVSHLHRVSITSFSPLFSTPTATSQLLPFPTSRSSISCQRTRMPSEHGATLQDGTWRSSARPPPGARSSSSST